HCAFCYCTCHGINTRQPTRCELKFLYLRQGIIDMLIRTMGRFLTALLIYSLAFMLMSAYVQAQHKRQSSPTLLFNKFEQAHQQGNLTDTAYLATIDSLTSHLLAKGEIFPVDTLLSYLSYYQHVAW